MVNHAPIEPTREPIRRPAGGQSRLFMAALTGMIAALAACWFVYDSHVQTSKAYLVDRNFRFLSAQGRALGAAIANYENIFQSILEGMEKEPVGETRCASKRYAPSEARTLCAAPHVKRVIVSESEKKQGELSIQFAKNEARLEYATRLAGCTKKTTQSVCSIYAEVDITKIMEDLPMEELFSDLLLTDNEGHVVYQRRSRQDSSDLQFTDLGILLAKKGSGYETILPAMEAATVGGTNFRVFAQAGLVSVRHHSTGAHNGIDFILSGIVPSERLDAEASAMPSHLLLIAIGMILAAFLTLPYLKLKALQPNESMTLTDVLTLMFSSFMWIGFLTFTLLVLVAHQHSHALFDQMLTASANAIRKNFADDLAEARRQLATLDTLCKNNRTCQETVVESGKDTWFVSFSISPKNGNYILQLEEPAKEPRTAALFSYDINKMFWVGRDGTKLVDWWRREAWQKVSLGERRYVRRILDGSGLSSSHFPGTEAHYWIEPTYSWISGKNTVVVSELSQVGDGRTSAVAALELRMPSVMDSVVQPGFGFAVVNDGGQVIFHSDSKRNLREDFFAETDQNEELRAHLLARTPHFSSGQYWGKDRRFFTVPLDDTDGWSLVVYRDSAILDDAELQALFSAVVLFILYAALILGVGLFGFVLYPDLKQGQGDWLRPRQQHAKTYRRILVLNITLLVLFGLVQGQEHLELHYPNWHQLLLLTPFVLTLVMALTVYVLVAFRAGQRGGNNSRYQRDYTIMAVSCFLLFAMVPAYGFFKFAWNGEMNLYALFTQFDFAKDLDQREQALKKFYHGVAFRPEAAGEQFVCARLAGYSRDVYTQFLFHPRLGARPGLSEQIVALLRVPLNRRLSSETAGLLDDRNGFNRAWLDRKQTGCPDGALSGVTTSAHNASLTVLPGIPDWVYWVLSLGALSASWGRSGLAQALGRSDHLAQMAVLLCLLILVIGFTIWPTLHVFLGVAAVALFLQILHALPRINDEVLRALDRTVPPAIDGLPQTEAQQGAQADRDRPGAMNFWNQILWPVKMGLVALAGFIIFTQEEYRPIALAALATILPEVSKLLPELNRILGGFKPNRARASAG